MAKSIKYGIAEWLADPELSARSITPPPAFEQVVSERHVDLSAILKQTADIIEVRKTQLRTNAAALKQMNDDGLQATVCTTAVKLEDSANDLEKMQQSALSQYQSMVTKYETYLQANPCMPHGYESYTFDSQSIRHYTVNSSAIVVDVGYTGLEQIKPKAKDEKPYTVANIVLGVAANETILTVVEETASKKSGPSSQPGAEKTTKIKLLHPLELEVLSNATSFLLGSAAKSVAVDIFDKDKDGRIKFDDKSEKLITHITVLYKQTMDSNNQIFLIDPSNSDFSKHLNHPILKAFVSRGTGKWVDIIAPQKPLQIYSLPSSDSVTGPRSDQFRSCDDIAVKLARGVKCFTR